jgi:replicative DNA helicase
VLPGILVRVETVARALEEFDRRALPWGLPTGLQRLDEVVTGMVPGQVWVLVGSPGHGRTTLLLQLAARFATTDLLVFVDTPREPAELSLARLLACLGKHPATDVLAGEPVEGLDLTRSRLAQSGLALAGAGSGRSVVRREQWVEHDPAALFLDDLDLLDDARPEHLATWASTGAFVCVTLPRHLVVRDGLDPGWARVADVVLEVTSEEVSLLKNRHGPLRDCPVDFQGHYARFVDLRS